MSFASIMKLMVFVYSINCFNFWDEIWWFKGLGIAYGMMFGQVGWGVSYWWLSVPFTFVNDVHTQWICFIYWWLGGVRNLVFKGFLWYLYITCSAHNHVFYWSHVLLQILQSICWQGCTGIPHFGKWDTSFSSS